MITITVKIWILAWSTMRGESQHLIGCHHIFTLIILVSSYRPSTECCEEASVEVSIEYHPKSSLPTSRGFTFMDQFDVDKFTSNRSSNLFYPFASRAEWEVASWLLRSGLSMALINDFMDLSIVCTVLFMESDLYWRTGSKRTVVLFKCKRASWPCGDATFRTSAEVQNLDSRAPDKASC